jgi:hypothetical protein
MNVLSLLREHVRQDSTDLTEATAFDDELSSFSEKLNRSSKPIATDQPPPRSQRSSAPSPKISVVVTEDQHLQRERSQRKLLNKQVNRQVQALSKSSKKRVESLQKI